MSQDPQIRIPIQIPLDEEASKKARAQLEGLAKATQTLERNQSGLADTTAVTALRAVQAAKAFGLLRQKTKETGDQTKALGKNVERLNQETDESTRKVRKHAAVFNLLTHALLEGSDAMEEMANQNPRLQEALQRATKVSAGIAALGGAIFAPARVGAQSYIDSVNRMDDIGKEYYEINTQRQMAQMALNRKLAESLIPYEKILNQIIESTSRVDPRVIQAGVGFGAAVAGAGVLGVVASQLRTVFSVLQGLGGFVGTLIRPNSIGKAYATLGGEAIESATEGLADSFGERAVEAVADVDNKILTSIDLSVKSIAAQMGVGNAAGAGADFADEVLDDVDLGRKTANAADDIADASRLAARETADEIVDGARKAATREIVEEGAEKAARTVGREVAEAALPEVVGTGIGVAATRAAGSKGAAGAAGAATGVVGAGASGGLAAITGVVLAAAAGVGVGTLVYNQFGKKMGAAVDDLVAEIDRLVPVLGLGTSNFEEAFRPVTSIGDLIKRFTVMLGQLAVIAPQIVKWITTPMRSFQGAILGGATSLADIIKNGGAVIKEAFLFVANNLNGLIDVIKITINQFELMGQRVGRNLVSDEAARASLDRLKANPLDSTKLETAMRNLEQAFRDIDLSEDAKEFAARGDKHFDNLSLALNKIIFEDLGKFGDAIQDVTGNLGGLLASGKSASGSQDDLIRRFNSLNMQELEMVEGYLDEIAQMEIDYARDRAIAVRDFTTQARRAEFDYNLQRRRALADFEKQRALEEKDFNRDRMREEADFYRNRRLQIQDFERDQARSLEEFNRNRMKAVRDFNLQERRRVQDYYLQRQRQEQDHRLSLLDSIGRLDAAAVMTALRDQQIERTRAMQDFNLEGQRNKADFDKQQREEQIEFERQAMLARIDFMRGLDRELAEYDRQRARALDDYNLQRARALAEFNLQRKREEEDRKLQLAREAEDFRLQELEARQQNEMAKRERERQFLDQLDQLKGQGRYELEQRVKNGEAIIAEGERIYARLEKQFGNNTKLFEDQANVMSQNLRNLFETAALFSAGVSAPNTSVAQGGVTGAPSTNRQAQNVLAGLVRGTSGGTTTPPSAQTVNPFQAQTQAFQNAMTAWANIASREIEQRNRITQELSKTIERMFNETMRVLTQGGERYKQDLQQLQKGMMQASANALSAFATQIQNIGTQFQQMQVRLQQQSQARQSQTVTARPTTRSGIAGWVGRRSFAIGGYTGEAGGLAMLHGGEFVLTRSTTDALERGYGSLTQSKIADIAKANTMNVGGMTVNIEIGNAGNYAPSELGGIVRKELINALREITGSR